MRNWLQKGLRLPFLKVASRASEQKDFGIIKNYADEKEEKQKEPLSRTRKGNFKNREISEGLLGPRETCGSQTERKQNDIEKISLNLPENLVGKKSIFFLRLSIWGCTFFKE